MIEVTPTLAIDENDLQFSFIRASGPGGQNVNKVATAVQLRYDLNRAKLPDEVRRRLFELAGNRISGEGILIIEAKQHRSQEQNRQEATARLVSLMRQAARKPKRRKKTKPGPAAKKRRLAEKRRRGRIKKLRRDVRDIDE